MWAYMIDGTRTVLWAEKLSTDWDWQAWTASRAAWKSLLQVAHFRVERIEL